RATTRPCLLRWNTRILVLVRMLPHECGALLVRQSWRPVVMRQTRHKYGARPVDGYASRLERDRARELRLLELAGDIREFVEQPRVELLPGIFFKPDSAYTEGDGTRVFEDCKGVETPRFR